MTSPTPVGTTTVLIRAVVNKVKDDIQKGVREGWSAAERDSLAAGRASGKRWATGFKYAVERAGVSEVLERQFKEAERQAGLSGARAGARYAAAFNAAARSANPPDPSSDENRPRPRTREPRATNGRAGGGGGSPGGGGSSRVRPMPGDGGNNDRGGGGGGRNQPRGDDGRWIGGGGRGGLNKPLIKQIIVKYINQGANLVLKSLSLIAVGLKSLIMLSAAAMAALAMQAAVAPLIAIVGVLSQMAGALLLLPALANAVALPLAALAVGFSGIGGAFEAMKSQSENAAQTAKAVETANKGVATAQRQVESAGRGVESAERGVTAAVRASERARESLNDTIKSTIERIQDLNLEMKGATLDEEDAVLGLERARERLANMPAGSSSLDYREAALGIKQAQQRLEEVRESNGDLAEETAQANAEGVEGSRQVRDARQAVADAAQGEKDADQALTDARQQLTDATTNLADAIKAVDEAAAGSGADKLAAAMAKLAPNARSFVTAMQGLGPQWTDLRKAVQDNLFANLDSDVVNLANVGLPTLKTGLAGLGTAFNGMFRDIIKAVAAPDAIEKFGIVLENVRGFIEKMRPGIFALVGVFKNLSLVGSEFLGGFADGFTKNAQKLERWSKNLDNVRSLIRRALDVGKLFFGILGNLGGAIGGVFSAGEETGNGFLQTLFDITARFENFVKSAQGQTALKEFFDSGAAAVSAIAPVLESVILGALELGQMLADLGTAISPGVLAFVDGLREAFEKIQPALEVIGPKLNELFKSLGTLMPQVGEAVSALMIAFSPYIDLMSIFARTILPVIVNLIEKFAPQIAALAPLIVGLALAWKAYNIYATISNTLNRTGLGLWIAQKAAMVGGAIATGLMSAAQGLLNAVMSANPIALVVIAIAALVAGIIIAYKNSETFRNIVQQVWEAFQVAVTIAWEIIKVVFDLLIMALGKVGDFFKWVWESLIRPAWDALGAGIAWVWDNIIRPTWDSLMAALQGIGDFFKWVWETLIKPAWDALGAGIQWVVDTFVTPAFDLFQQGLQNLGQFVEDVVSGIKTAWEKLQDIIKAPVRFVVDTVYNKGIKPAWNAIATKIGMDPLPDISLPEGFKDGGVPGGPKGRTTGVMSGYSPGRDDRIIAVGGGEAVMRPEFTRAVGPGTVNTINAAARNGGVRGVQSLLNENPRIPRFALGGPVDLNAAPWAGGGGESNLQPAAILARRNIKKYWPEIDTIGGYRASDPYPDHPSGLALDVMTGNPMGTQINDWLHAQKDALALNYTIWQQMYKPAGGGGNMMEDRGSPTQNHMDHIHALFNANGVAGIEAGGVGSDGSGGGGFIRGLILKAYKAIVSPIKGLIDSATAGFGENEIAQIPNKLFESLNSKVESFITGKESAGGSGGNSDWEPSAGAEQWRGMITDAYKNQGYESSPAKIDAWVRQIDSESGGDPNIAQQITDVNGTGEAAGVGLGQMIPGTWAAYRDPALPDNRRDPWAMTNAMVRYGEQKFGPTLLDVIGHGHGYDNGGWLQPGLTLANNQSGVPEPVFTGGQWDILKQGLNFGGANEYMANNMPSLQSSLETLAVDAFKETVISGLFGAETIGIDGIINKAVDTAVSEARSSRDMAMAGAPTQQAGIIAQGDVNFIGMDPQKVGEEVNRAQGAGMGATNGRYRQP